MRGQHDHPQILTLWNGLAGSAIFIRHSWKSGTAQACGFGCAIAGLPIFQRGSHQRIFSERTALDLHGVDMHQDWYNCGWALTNAQRDTNFAFLKELGATAVRLSHYETTVLHLLTCRPNGIILLE